MPTDNLLWQTTYMKIMFAITSQAHNLNKFAFLLNAVKDRLKQRLPRNLLFPSSDPTAIIQLKIDGAQLMIRLACLCPCLLCVCPAVLCSSHLLEQWVHLQEYKYPV
jgi:hypothetical protein